MSVAFEFGEQSNFLAYFHRIITWLDESATSTGRNSIRKR
jgi:hypothetical protein